MKELHYHATNIGKINCDGCDTFLCYGFDDRADDCGFLCAQCKLAYQIQEVPEIKSRQFERLMSFYLEMECGLSAKGHHWLDITSQCFVMGAKVFRCLKCPANKQEPYQTFFGLKIGPGEIPLATK